MYEKRQEENEEIWRKRERNQNNQENIIIWKQERKLECNTTFMEM